MLDYKKNINSLIYFIAKYNNLGIMHNRIKQISNDEYKCINEQEKEIKSFLIVQSIFVIM